MDRSSLVLTLGQAFQHATYRFRTCGGRDRSKGKRIPVEKPKSDAEYRSLKDLGVCRDGGGLVRYVDPKEAVKSFAAFRQIQKGTIGREIQTERVDDDAVGVTEPSEPSKEESFWDKYKWWIIGGAAGTIVAGIVTWLLFRGRGGDDSYKDFEDESGPDAPIKIFNQKNGKRRATIEDDTEKAVFRALIHNEGPDSLVNIWTSVQKKVSNVAQGDVKKILNQFKKKKWVEYDKVAETYRLTLQEYQMPGTETPRLNGGLRFADDGTNVTLFKKDTVIKRLEGWKGEVFVELGKKSYSALELLEHLEVEKYPKVAVSALQGFLSEGVEDGWFQQENDRFSHGITQVDSSEVPVQEETPPAADEPRGSVVRSSSERAAVQPEHEERPVVESQPGPQSTAQPHDEPVDWDAETEWAPATTPPPAYQRSSEEIYAQNVGMFAIRHIGAEELVRVLSDEGTRQDLGADYLARMRIQELSKPAIEDIVTAVMAYRAVEEAVRQPAPAPEVTPEPKTAPAPKAPSAPRPSADAAGDISVPENLGEIGKAQKLLDETLNNDEYVAGLMQNGAPSDVWEGILDAVLKVKFGEDYDKHGSAAVQVVDDHDVDFEDFFDLSPKKRDGQPLNANHVYAIMRAGVGLEIEDSVLMALLWSAKETRWSEKRKGRTLADYSSYYVRLAELFRGSSFPAASSQDPMQQFVSKIEFQLDGDNTSLFDPEKKRSFPVFSDEIIAFALMSHMGECLDEVDPDGTAQAVKRIMIDGGDIIDELNGLSFSQWSEDWQDNAEFLEALRNMVLAMTLSDAEQNNVAYELMVSASATIKAKAWTPNLEKYMGILVREYAEGVDITATSTQLPHQQQQLREKSADWALTEGLRGSQIAELARQSRRDSTPTVPSMPVAAPKKGEGEGEGSGGSTPPVAPPTAGSGPSSPPPLPDVDSAGLGTDRVFDDRVSTTPAWTVDFTRPLMGQPTIAPSVGALSPWQMSAFRSIGG